MEFREDFKIHGQWIPATPVKPVLEKRPPSTISPASWLESVNRATGGLSDGELRGMALDREMLAQMPYTQLFEAAEAGTVSSMNFSPQMTAQNVELNAADSNWDHSLLKGRTFLPPLPPKSHFITEAMAPLATPATMEKNQHGSLHDLLAHKFIDLVSDTVSYRDAQQQYEPSELQLSVEENHKDHSFSLQPTEGLRIMGDDSFEGITARQAEGENQVIDSSSTPQQKHKRKKHRPKVIKEGNPARTSKPRTPKAPQTASVKRKYVRKKKDPNLQETPACMHDEIADQEGRRKKPVRRCLNFDVEESEELDRWAGSLPVMCRHNLTETQAQEAHAGDVNCSEGLSLAQLVSGNVRVPHTPSKLPQPSRLEAMRGKFQDDFTRMLSKLIPSPETERRKGENLKKLARKNVCLDIAGESERNLVGRQNEVDSASTSDVFLKGAEGDHNLIDRVHAELDRMSGSNNTSSAEPSVDGIHKKRKIVNDESERNSTDAECSMANEKRQALERMLMSNQAEREKANRLQAHSILSWRADYPKESSQLTHIRTSEDNQKESRQPSIPEKAPKTKKCEENATNGPRDRLDVMNLTPAKPRGRRPRKKEGIALVSSTASNACQTEPVAAASGTGFSLATESALRIFNEHIASMQTSLVQGGSPSPAFLSGDPVTYREQVDALAQKLEHLKIDGGHQDITCQLQNAVVPFVGAGGMIVSFQGSPDVIKKRKPRAKVDLDPESNRVWNLLMGKDSTEGDEGSEVDKEKWWEEERRVFQGRVDSFIARMHLIQGDRRFSRWKGSVVDSVIGVFLTQNVSDHLSSSAFMCLAARFPLQSNGNNNNPSAEAISRSIPVDDSTDLRVKSLEQDFCNHSALGINETEEKNNKEVASSNESLESNYSLLACHGEGLVDYLKENSSDFSQRELGIGNESPSSASGTAVTVTSCTSVTAEDVVSSQNSVVSSQNSSEYPNRTIYQDGMSPLLNVEADNLLGGGVSNGSNTFMELLQMAGNGKITSAEYGNLIRKTAAVPNGPAFINCLGTSGHSSNSKIHLKQHDFMGLSCSPSYCDKDFSNSRFMGLENSANEGYQSSSPFSSLEKIEKNINQMTGRLNHPSANSSTDGTHHNNLSAPKFSWFAGSQSPIRNNSTQTITSLGNRVCIERHSYQGEVSSDKVIFNICGYQQDRNAGVFPQGTTEAELQVNNTQEQVLRQDEILNYYPATCSAIHIDHQRKDLLSAEAAESNLRNEAHTSQKVSTETLNNLSKTKALKSENEKKSYDWDSLRKQACHNSAKRERSKDTMDSLDYEALRRADVNEIAHTIRERGMNNRLAERIKDFLDRVVRDHGSIDLEWLRDAPPDKVKDYLLSIRGLGLKSVECVRLLTLHHLAFPVDTNVGRICVRLGWVPLQPLPESLQLHLLEMYPVQETIQKYLWPRLCKLDQLTLYELHYQLITFGKVFCTKSKPNCNACPMRGECKHFASAFASARLALPGPEEKSLVTSENHNPIPGAALFQNQMPVPRLEGCTSLHERHLPRSCEPIIEEPATPEPEPECTETSEIDIEDAFYNDPDEIPTIKLNFEEFTHNLHNYIQRNGMGLEDGDMSKALVAITPEAASIPMPKLKNVNRLRTEHLVYELPDSHPLLDGMDKREPDDPCPYLLAIWTPGETPQSTEPPSASCDSQDTGTLCDRSTCFSCNSIREAQTQIVRGTLLIPCRTANRGSFPLNGTYFQVNEVFADHFSSCSPIDVPRNWIWNLPRRTVYFGTSIPSIFKGLTTEGIQLCFWRGFVCVRGFDRMTRAPKPLFARLHFPASKATRNRRTGSTSAARGSEQR